ncbi:Do family serine endopeptidase [uncultured Rikenella sp.]|uniref:Do family serine endopeptidase n=1 Tax=uncultured Rikenella sp. TaxID=368003 RepID=UPI002637BA92|nr:Do family serine endopeptidase [uncultured Rikenella sp.]
MRKRWMILSVSLSVAAGSLAAYSVSRFTAERYADRAATTVTYDNETADTHFASAPVGSTQGILPDFTAAAEQGVEAVVNIENRQKYTVRQYSNPFGGGGIDPFEFFFGPSQGQQQPSQPQQKERRSGGSGVILSADGYIVSNNHVVEGADELIVTLHDGSTYKAALVGTDPSTDIALLKIDAKGLKTIPFGNSEELRLGEWVLAIGNPYGLTSTVTAGIVSAKGRSLGVMTSQMGIESFIQTDAVVNPGNSGGALITTEGKLIGINTVIKSPTGFYMGYSFAVPSSIVRKVVTDLREYGVVQRAMLGISFQAITPDWVEHFGEEKGIKEPGGIYIAEVVEDGAAQAAGIKPGDVLTHIGGKAMNTTADVQETIAKLRPNDKIKVTVKRDGSVKEYDVTLRNRAGKTDLVKKDDVNLLDELGATFREVSDKQKKELRIRGGIQVVSLKEDGLLARSRVQRGFIITAINDMPIAAVSDLNRITDKVQSIDGIYPDGRIVSYQALGR